MNSVNDAPVLTVPAVPFMVAENSPNGTLVGSVSASDVDTGDSLSFIITGGNTGTAFVIDPVNGQLTVANKSALDFETTPVFDLTVQVQDDLGETDDAIITVSLNDLEANLAINDATAVETNAGTTLTFEVTLDTTINDDFAVIFGTTNDSASDGTGSTDLDYSTTSGLLNFTGTADETHYVGVPIQGDQKVEPDETFFVDLGSLSGTNDVTIIVAQGVGTI